MTARTLMVQGTTSDAGKSLLVTALCRWLSRRGVRVAPFKAQNMALNSAVTPEGGEIGRAQAVQAAACRLAPHTDMNPVLLKPNSDTGAQIIIHGRAVANMNARGYHDYKRVAREAVLASHMRLADAFDVIVAEGAGSPAEINLRTNDIANMGFAEAVDCPVILIADIDRGGVFAHIVGTLALLSESERARLAGFVINRFRGDISLLQPGLDWLERETGKPVIGVLPYLRGLFLDAEDAIVALQPEKSADALRVVVPVLPRISNHTDFDALRLHPRVDLRFVALSDEMPAADLIILPGSKSVRADLAALRAAGWETRLTRHLRYGGKVIGICGGMQMLGTAIHDPEGIEGEAGSATGFGLLDFETTLAASKTLCNREGVLSWCGAPVRGYEIHAGVSSGPALAMPATLLAPPLPLAHWERTELRVFGVSQSGGILGEGRNLSRDSIPSPHMGEGLKRRIRCETEQQADGAISADNQIIATYLHGLFDAPAACDALLAWAGLAPTSGEGVAVNITARREAEFDRLADMVSEHLDTALIAQLCGVAP